MNEEKLLVYLLRNSFYLNENDGDKNNVHGEAKSLKFDHIDDRCRALNPIQAYQESSFRIIMIRRC